MSRPRLLDHTHYADNAYAIIDNGNKYTAQDIADISDRVGNIEYTANTTETTVDNHTSNKSNPHSVTKSQVGLGNVTNDKQMPIAGGTFTGDVFAYSTNRTGECLRNITVRDTAGTTDQSTNFIRFDRK